MMELDQIKENWALLDSRLKKAEGLNNRIIKEMLLQKSGKSLNKLFSLELAGIAICLLMTPFLFFMFSLLPHTTPYIVLKYYSLVFICLSFIFQLHKISLLRQINLQENIIQNIKFLQRYNIFIGREKIIMLITTYLFMCMIAIILLSFKNVEIWRWIGIIFTVIGVIPLLAYWQYGRFYKSHIRSISDSLEELNDLE